DMSNTSPTAAGTLYTICVFTENTIGLLNKITILFSRRRINIESLTVSESERKGVSRFTIVIHHTSREEVEKLVRQIRKIIEVLAVFGYLNEEIAYNRSEEHTSELQSRENIVCRLLLEK